MRYKEQALDQTEKLENILRNIEGQINRNETREAVLETLQKAKDRLEQLRSQINIEPGDFFSSK